MVKTLKVPSREVLEEMTQEKDLSISKIVIDRIAETIENEEEMIHIMDIEIDDEEEILEVKLPKTEFQQALERNLVIHELHEDYENCTKIKSLLNKFYNER
tara:strand:- start:1429 stop:1731 length:303 start_codon:yes stop_codon:yes gene_type:complete